MDGVDIIMLWMNVFDVVDVIGVMDEMDAMGAMGVIYWTDGMDGWLG